VDSFFYWFLLFFIYGIIGYLIETVGCSVAQKRFVNRGFLFGPYLPIWGFGALLITLLLTRFEGNYLTLFLLGALLCGILEYFVSWLLEKVFRNKWWHYRNPDNIHGRVRVSYVVGFGLGTILIIAVLNPLLFAFLGQFSPNTIIVFGSIFLLLLACDTTHSALIAHRSRHTTIVAEELKNQKIAMVGAKTKKYIKSKLKKR
jgi:uncharacterized membrane protein